MNGVNLNNINSLSDIEHVLDYVETVIDNSWSEKSPPVVMETAKKCVRILGEVLKSEAGNPAAIRGRLIGLAEGLGVSVAESSVPDANIRAQGIRKFWKGRILFSLSSPLTQISAGSPTLYTNSFSLCLLVRLLGLSLVIGGHSTEIAQEGFTQSTEALTGQAWL